MIRSVLLGGLAALSVATPALAQDAVPATESVPAETLAAEVPPADAAVVAPVETAPVEATATEAAPMEAAPEAPAAETVASDEASANPPVEESRSGRNGANDTIGDRWYVAPMFTYVWGDKDRPTDDGYGATLALGKKLGSALAIELNGYYNRFSNNVQGNGSAALYGGGLSLLVSPFSGLRDLYAIGSVQYGRTDDLPGSLKNYDSVVYGAGLGYLYKLTDAGTALRTEVLYRWDTHDDGDAGYKDFGDIVGNIGLMIPFGGVPQPEVTASNTEPAAVVPVAAEGDEDGDGVVDRLDRCPGTAPGTTVDENGCPLPAPVAPPPSCKTPAPGEAITLEGCAAGDTIVLQGVTFEFNQARLTANAKTILDGVADALTARAEIRVEVGGHTDSRGSDSYNQKLSENRAQSVMQYLIGKGIDAGRMSAKGYGESHPVADNETDDGRELNRRVELKIVE
ncbi:OmpA family protein [Hydrocarboniphaga effusa]|jgi:OOP family OmpA-OmpF porin|uniref:OmpA-like domain-containing protein n=1 Tax=Hydrocarboniphaga effusa AP103 TaxID=1172194 RepID=I8T2W4_9GAMM|nr:OmpA family protein [Hydrocarboniphaga effusa]EIT68280.1 hypothetical protein WQQ_34750 [Hydrocarboniphaga effusa AP103]